MNLDLVLLGLCLASGIGLAVALVVGLADAWRKGGRS